MPRTQTLGDMIKLGDLPLEEREQIAKSIKYNAEHNSELFSEVNHEKLSADRTSMTIMRSYLPKIDKTSDRYINGLIEGITPDPESINEAEYAVSVIENGWYFEFTKKAVTHAWSDIKARCSKFLQNVFASYHDEKIADAYLSSSSVITSCNLLEYGDLLALGTILFKNGAVAFDGGFYKLRVAPELGDAMLLKYKDLLTHTTEKEAVVQGEIGEIAGFRIIKSRLQAFAYDPVAKTAPFVAYGKNNKGEYPVSIVSYDNMADSVMVTPFGGLGNDPLKQRGAIGLYVDGHAFYVVDDSICLRGASSITLDSVDYVHTVGNAFTEATRSNLIRSGGAREITPEFDYVKLHRYSSGTTATTFTLKATKANGTAWAFDDDGAGKLKVVSGSPSVVTVADGVVTTVGVGIATLVISQFDKPEFKTVITVEVVAGAGASPVI